MTTRNTQKKETRAWGMCFRTRGFTFVEMLVAISVLLLAVVGPLYLASQGLRAARIARDQINANYLAQEAIEHIRYRRDTNILSGDTWMTGMQLCLSQSCTIDIYNNQGTIASCDGTCPLIRFHEDTGIYGGYGEVDGWEDTKFTRTINLSETVSNQEVEVAVTVSWQDGLINRTYTLTEHLFNWQ